MRANLYSLVMIMALVELVYGQQGTCGGDCIFSEDCAMEAGDQDCRCSYFHCRVIPPGSCGGGCILDHQCSEWAGGDENCVCGTLYDCVNRREMESPQYQAFAKFMLSIRGSEYQTKMSKMLQLYQEKENYGQQNK